MESLEMASCYPDCEMTKLREKLARKELGAWAGPEHVIAGNGASELIYALCQAVKPEDAMVTAPAFKEYETAVRIAGGNVIYETLHEENAFILTEKITERITPEIDLLFLCNPNNPTGQTIPRKMLIRIAERCEQEDTFFCMDECFLPFMTEEEDFTMKEYLASFPHLVILKAFTKIFGMAGIRFGYLLSANTELLGKIRSVIQPWNVSVPAQAAAMAAMEEDLFVEQTKKLVRKEREYLRKEMQALNVALIGSPAANYIFFKGSSDLAERFLEQGVLIRSCSNYTGLSEGYFRIGVRSPEENRAFIEIFQKILQQDPEEERRV